MANNIGWGSIYSVTNWGKGVINNISWGKIYADLVGVLPSFALNFANISTDFTFTRNSSSTRVNEQGLIETVSDNTPRIDYSSGEGAFLLEPASTNLLPYSEGFTVAEGWSNTRLLAIPNSTVSPNGIMEGTKLVENTDFNSRNVTDLLNSTGSGDTVVGSVFVKKADHDYIMIKIIDNAANVNGELNYYRVSFNIANGTFNADLPTGSPINPFYNIEDYGNGWYRISVGLTKKNNAVRTDFEIQLVNSGANAPNPVYQGDGVSGTYIWGAQVEALPHATSYIPTNGSIATRAGELCLGATPTINSEEGVLYAEISSLEEVSSSNKYLSLSDKTYNNRVSILYNLAGTNQIRVFLRVGGVVQTDRILNVSDVTDINKVAISYKQGELKIYLNGSLSNSVSGSVWAADTLTDLSFSEIGSSLAPFYGRSKGLRVYTEALTDDELVALTTI